MLRLLLLTVVVVACYAIPQSQFDALIDLYDRCGGEKWKNNTNWGMGNGTSVCDPDTPWFGIACEDDSLVLLVLESNDLKGDNCKLTDKIAAFENLQILDLSSNQIKGGIPEELWGLSELLVIDLSHNKFDSVIQNAPLDSLSDLRDLNLESNKLSGELPVDVDQLTSLASLLLNDNQFTGSIPETYGIVLNRQVPIDLANNSLSGKLPSWLANVSFFEINLAGNKWECPIPDWEAAATAECIKGGGDDDDGVSETHIVLISIAASLLVCCCLWSAVCLAVFAAKRYGSTFTLPYKSSSRKKYSRWKGPTDAEEQLVNHF